MAQHSNIFLKNKWKVCVYINSDFEKWLKRQRLTCLMFSLCLIPESIINVWIIGSLHIINNTYATELKITSALALVYDCNCYSGKFHSLLKQNRLFLFLSFDRWSTRAKLIENLYQFSVILYGKKLCVSCVTRVSHAFEYYCAGKQTLPRRLSHEQADHSSE